MKKAQPLKILNPILAALALWQFGTIAVNRLFGLDTYRAHELGGYLIALAILAHVVLNRAWIKASYFAARNKREG